MKDDCTTNSHLYISLQKGGRMYFFELGIERVNGPGDDLNCLEFVAFSAVTADS